jgi:hypothetical protein
MALSDRFERWFPGAARVLAWRALALLIAMLPTLLVTVGALEAGPALEPYFTDGSGQLSLIGLIRLSKNLQAVPATIALGAMLMLGFDLILTAGALSFFNPNLDPPSRGVLGYLLVAGGRVFWPLLRIATVAAILLGAGIAGINAVAHRAVVAGWREGWTGLEHLEVRAAQALAIAGWLALVGAWQFWCRVITVADGRRRVWRSALLVFPVWKRHPVRGPFAFLLLSTLTIAASGLVVVEWRQAAPANSSAVLTLAVMWLLSVLLQAFVWQVLIRGALQLYESPSLSDLRGIPDQRSKSPLPALAPEPPLEEPPLEEPPLEPPVTPHSS